MLPATRHETPVLCILGLAPFSLVSNNQKWNLNVDAAANSLFLAYKEKVISTPRTHVRVLDLGPGNGALQCGNSVYQL